MWKPWDGGIYLMAPTKDVEEVPSNVRFTACPNTCLFSDGAQYQVNSTMIENQQHYYQAAMVQLYTKYDSQADTSVHIQISMLLGKPQRCSNSARLSTNSYAPTVPPR